MSEHANSAPAADRQTILILGTGRSGTSALGGVVNLLGATAPKTLLSPQPDNPRGFYESAPLIEANDALLASAGSRWDDWRALNPKWDRSSTAKAHQKAIRQTLDDEYGTAPLFFIKDPRICRVVPLYVSILREMGVSGVALLPIRNPLEVAYSLRRQYGLPLAKSLLLWLRNVLEAEHGSRALPRCFLPYDRFLLDWRPQLERAAERTGIVWPAQSDSTGAAIDRFLALDLHRERATTREMERHPGVMALMCETYAVLGAMAADGESNGLIGQLDKLRAGFNDGCATFGPAIAAAEAEAHEARSEAARHTQEADEVRAALEDHKQRFDESQSALKDHMRRLNEAESALEDHKQRFEESQSALKDHMRRLNEAQSALEDHKKRLDEAQARHEAQVVEAQAELERRTSDIARLATDRDAARADLHRALVSRSWRWTAPLRRLRQLRP